MAEETCVDTESHLEIFEHEFSQQGNEWAGRIKALTHTMNKLDYKNRKKLERLEGKVDEAIRRLRS
jgi:hypothetical protein